MVQVGETTMVAATMQKVVWSGRRGGPFGASRENGVHMPLIKPITKHGNSAGIILEQAVLRMVDWEVGTKVEIQVTSDSIVLKRHPTHGHRSTERPSRK